MKIVKETLLREDVLTNEFKDLISSSKDISIDVNNLPIQLGTFVLDLLNGQLKKYGLKRIKYKLDIL